MRTFRKHLNEQLQDQNFKNCFEEEKQLLELSLKIYEERERTGLTQIEVADRAHITQQQLSKVENGENCNILTFLKVCKALNLQIGFDKINYIQPVN